jgi:hypothetical protein
MNTDERESAHQCRQDKDEADPCGHVLLHFLSRIDTPMGGEPAVVAKSAMEWTSGRCGESLSRRAGAPDAGPRQR